MPTIILNPIVTASHNVPTFVDDKSEVGFGGGSGVVVPATLIPDCVDTLRAIDLSALHQIVLPEYLKSGWNFGLDLGFRVSGANHNLGPV